MRFQVPQFIDVEDKIFGPFTLKQFIYLAGGAGLSFIVYSVVGGSLLLATVPIVLIMGISWALGFYKVNNKPLINVIEAGFKYYLGNKLFIWKKDETVKPTEAAAVTEAQKNFASLTVPKISDSKLKDLTWSLDVQDSIYSEQKKVK